MTDFSGPWSGLRDLSKSKFHLKKGDAQMEFTYSNAPRPHHVPEGLSDLTVCVYLARCLPHTTLRRVVRADFQAREYPARCGPRFPATA